MTSTATIANQRKLPFLGECIYFPVTVTAALLHVVAMPLGIEPTLSMLVTGGFFGLVLVPLGMAALFLWLLDSFVYKGIASLIVFYIGIPFVVVYVIQILIWDQSHLQVKNAYPHLPRNQMEEMARDFFYSSHEYLSFSCVPWSDSATLDTNQNYVFAVHPHGIHCTPLYLFSTRGSAFDQRFPDLVDNKLTGLAATVMFKLPLVRELFIIMGYIDASRAVANKALEAGRSIYICTGGEEESILTEKGQDIVVLRKRKGFVRLALSHGAALVPVFGVGNSDLYQVRMGSFIDWIWLRRVC